MIACFEETGGSTVVQDTNISQRTDGAGPGAALSFPDRRAVLKAAASAPVILTLKAGPARAAYNKFGDYIPGVSCDPPDADPTVCGE